MEKRRLKVLLTGASGFVGRRFSEFNSEKYEIVPFSLRDPRALETADFRNVDVIVHLAGKAHEMKPIEDEIYFRVNYDLTRELAGKAMESGVPHFIYASSTKVYGDNIDEEMSEFSPCIPTDAYGKSKLMAEEYLTNKNNDEFNVSIIRPPLVYGPYVKGNMVNLLNICTSRLPLPFSGIANSRSIVFIDNLIALINNIIDKKMQGVFIAGDLRPVSTTELVGYIRKHLGRKPRLFKLPASLLILLRKLKPTLYQRLFGSFVVNNVSTNEKVNFTPPFSTDEGIETMVKWFKTSNAR